MRLFSRRRKTSPAPEAPRKRWSRYLTVRTGNAAITVGTTAFLLLSFFSMRSCLKTEIEREARRRLSLELKTLKQGVLADREKSYLELEREVRELYARSRKDGENMRRAVLGLSETVFCVVTKKPGSDSARRCLLKGSLEAEKRLGIGPVPLSGPTRVPLPEAEPGKEESGGMEIPPGYPKSVRVQEAIR